MTLDKTIPLVCKMAGGIVVGAFGIVVGFLFSPYLAVTTAGPIRQFSVNLGWVVGWTAFVGSTVAGLAGGVFLGIRIGGGVSEAILSITNHFRTDHTEQLTMKRTKKAKRQPHLR